MLTTAASAVVDGQTAGTRGRAAPRGRGAAPVTRTEPAIFDCPSLLGEGVQTKRSFCDVLTGRDTAEGIIIKLPPHTGQVTLRFDLHNRHTYSEELIKTNRAYRHYTATIGVLTADNTLITRALVQNEFRTAPATIGVLTADNTLITRALVQNEFRTAADLVDRVAGGAGPGGVKAVAPTGSESITVTIPAAEESVSILGEKLTVIRADSPDNPDSFTTPGRPIAIISNVTLEYRPAPARRAPARRR
jgi:hypothetical protein